MDGEQQDMANSIPTENQVCEHTTKEITRVILPHP